MDASESPSLFAITLFESYNGTPIPDTRTEGAGGPSRATLSHFLMKKPSIPWTLVFCPRNGRRFKGDDLCQSLSRL